jgi:hypothetical protein
MVHVDDLRSASASLRINWDDAFLGASPSSISAGALNMNAIITVL